MTQQTNKMICASQQQPPPPHLNKKLFHVETWTVEQVLSWSRGVADEEGGSSSSSKGELLNYFLYYKEVFRSRQITGKRLQILDLADLNEWFPQLSLNHRLLLYKSVQELVQFRHDLKTDTLHTLLTHTCNKLVGLLKLVETNNRREFVKATACFISITYRKLINWLIRLPFTRLRQFELFRVELNTKMKQFLKMFRSKSKLQNGGVASGSNDEEIKQIVSNL